MPKPVKKKSIQPVQPAPSARVPWEFRHLLLIPLPGLVFTVVFYLVLCFLESRHVPTQKHWPENYKEWSAHYLGASLWSVGIAGVLAVILCIWGAVILIRARHPGKKLVREEISLWAFYLFMVNAAISYGGFIVGEHYGRVHDQPITELPEKLRKTSL